MLSDGDGVLRTQSGEAVDMRPQSREVLRLLASSPNQTITKDTFSSAIWDGRQVSEDSLVQCIAEIRSALGDSDRKIIQTIPRKGYRFVPQGAARIQPNTTHQRKLAALAAIIVIAALLFGTWTFLAPDSKRLQVVAVLPLDDLSPAPHQGYLSDALAEGIITELARFPQFQVIARNSSFQFRDKATDVREIGETLGAGFVVEGSQQYDGEKLNVTVQLVDAQTGAHIFADRYERDLHDLFAVQNDIVRHVASVVGQSILSEMPKLVDARDVDSRLRGLQARKIMTQLSYENWQKAMALEETSIREEPDSAWGYIGKSLMLGAAAALGWMQPREDVLDEATDLAETALRLSPENYMAHYTLARVLSRRSEYQESILHFQRAAELNPSDSIIWIGMSVPLLYSGETTRALEVLAQAAKVDPLHGDWLRWQLGLAHWQNNDCEQGHAAMQSMSSPPVSSAKALAVLQVCLDRIDDAQATIAEFTQKRPDYTLESELAAIPADWKPDGTASRWIDSLRQAGLR